MKRGARIAWLVALALVTAGLVALRSAGDMDYWRRYLAAVARGNPEPDVAQINPRIVVKGEGGALPVATPEAEGIYPEAITEAQKTAQQQGSAALLVHRHGHRVSTWFAAGRDGTTLVSGGDLSPMLLVLATGALADARQVEFTQAVADIGNATRHVQDGWRNPWSAAAHARFSLAAPPAYLMKDLEGTLANTLSLRIWQPLGAGDAWLWGVDDSSLRLDCCVAARVDDWMRVADLILRNGEYEGNRIVSADWMRHVLAFDAEGVAHPVWVTPAAFSGDEPPAARETFWFDLGPDLRLWLLPRRGLSILHWAAPGTGRSRDTTIPNIIIRGMVEQQLTPGASELRDIVPGH
jgi:hypothetical protein